MDSCTVNGRQHDMAAGLKTWGHLLHSLEQGVGAERVVVTAVRFGGVDEPSFRHAHACERDLTAVSPVAIDTATVRELLTSAGQTVLDGLEPLALAAKRTAQAFRMHDLPRAHRVLAEFVGTFQTLTRLTAVVMEIEAVGERSAETGEFLDRLHQNLQALVTHAMSEDWISVAEVLDYDIADILPRWTALLQDVNHASLTVKQAS